MRHRVVARRCWSGRSWGWPTPWSPTTTSSIYSTGWPGTALGLLAADAAGILLVDARSQLRVVASTNEQSDWMELLQIEADEGPCVDCVRTSAPVSVADLAEVASRWPRFVASLAERGEYGSVHALPLRLRGESIGALNLFHHRPGALPDADLVLAQALADVATIGILSERAINRGEVLNEQLQTALTSRVVIEQAKGVLAQLGDLTMDAAFGALRRFARDHNLRLSELARQVVEGGRGPEILAVPAAR